MEIHKCFPWSHSTGPSVQKAALKPSVTLKCAVSLHARMVCGHLRGSLWLYLEGLETGPSWRKRSKGHWLLQVIAHPSSRLSLMLPGLQTCDKCLPCAPTTMGLRSHAFLTVRDHVPINCDPKVVSSPLEMFLSGVPLWGQEDEQLAAPAGPGWRSLTPPAA